jgi:hypothetical protein
VTDALPGEEPADPLLRAVAEYWDDIIGRAGEEQAARLQALIAGTADSDPVAARAMLGDELLELLPGDHPVSRVMQTAIMYSTPVPEARSRLALAMQWLRAQVAGGRPGPIAPGDAAAETAAARRWPAQADEFDRQVQDRLLSLPSLTAEEVRRNQVDPGDGGLIRLVGPDRQVRLPAFQFTAAGQPWPVVREINEQLGASADPWGVTCWWIDLHQRLAGRPSDLLGRDSDHLLRWAAALVGEEW